MLVDKFIHGLKSKTRIEFEIKDSSTLNKALRLIDRYDAIFYRRGFNHEPENYNKMIHEPQYEKGGEFVQIDVL